MPKSFHLKIGQTLGFCLQTETTLHVSMIIHSESESVKLLSDTVQPRQITNPGITTTGIKTIFFSPVIV